jgi:hypothetical protein
VSNAGTLDTSDLENISNDRLREFENDTSANVMPATISTSDLSQERTFDMPGSPPMPTDWSYHFNTPLDISHKSQDSSYPTLSSSRATRNLNTPDQTSATSPSINLNEFDIENLFNDMNDFGAPIEYPLSSFQFEDPDDYNLHAGLAISLHGSFPKSMEPFPSYPFVLGPAYPWIETWPVQDLDEQTWSEVASAKALSRPESKTVERLLCLYFQYLNPHLPVINERDIYYLFHPEFEMDSVRPKPISLALFNAIMFTASSVSCQFILS